MVNDLKKEIYFATLAEKHNIIIRRRNIKLLKIIIENKNILNYQNITVKKAKKVKRLSINMYLVEDNNSIYYVLISNDNKKLDTYIAISDNLPVIGENFRITRLIYNYGSCFEDKITTSYVKDFRIITPNLYKVKTKHTYYVIIS